MLSLFKAIKERLQTYRDVQIRTDCEQADYFRIRICLAESSFNSNPPFYFPHPPDRTCTYARYICVRELRRDYDRHNLRSPVKRL